MTEIVAEVDSVEMPASSDVTTDLTKPSMTSLPAINYYLMLGGFLTGLTFLAAVIIAYVSRDSFTGDLLEAHRRFQIRTFWWSLGGVVLAAITWFLVEGVFISIAVSVWTLYRVIKGIVRLNNGRQP